MCVPVIIDADSIPLLVSRQGGGDDALLKWLREGHGILTIPLSGIGRYWNEVRKNRAFMELIRRYEQGGRVRKVSRQDILLAINQLKKAEIRSNDVHVLALALASDATVLCSGDRKLGDDFKNQSILPRIGHRKRALYPLNSKAKTRHGFLSNRKCRKRLGGSILCRN